jgi:CheY-like chemotaxis protein
MKILVAEDDSTLRGELADFLRGEGHSVEEAANGPEAIRKIRSGRFEVAFLDWMMPGATGGDVLEQTRDARAKTAVIVMTGYGSVDAAVAAMKSGARDFLEKPFELDALQRAMDSIRRELSSATRAKPPRTAKRHTKDSPQVRAAFLHSKHGLLLGAKVAPGEKTGDEDLLVATLNVIQNFMRVSFPILKGKLLRSIVQGDHTLITEPGRAAFLTVVLRGDEPEGLRARLREELRTFEDANRKVLANAGIVDDVQGADELLSSLVNEHG